MPDAVILPSNGRPRNVLNRVETGSGDISIDVVPENDAVAITCYVDSIAAGSFFDISVYLCGDAEDNIKLLYQFPQVTQAQLEPMTVIIPANGRVKLEICHTDSVSFELNAKAVSASTLIEQNTQAVQIVPTNDELAHRELMISCLDQMNETLSIILNHQRVLTDLNKDKGEIF